MITKTKLSKNLLTFSKWQKKGYSAFNSLKRNIRIGVLLPTYSMLLMPVALFSQPDTVTTSKNVDIDEVIIESRKRASIYSEMSRAVLVVTKEELKAVPVSTLNDLLEHLAGIDLRQRGGHNIQADLSVRGGTFDQVLVLLNGINITDPQTGHHNLNIPIDFECIDRIEILRGPGTRIYGPGAFSGAINIITMPSGKVALSSGITIGQHGLLKTQTVGNLSAGKVKSLLAFSTGKSDGYIMNTDFSSINLFSNTELDIKKTRVSLQAGLQDKEFGAQAFYTPRFPEQFEATSTLLLSQSAAFPLNTIHVNQKVYYRKHFDRFELFRNEAPAWYLGHNYHSTDVWGASLDGTTSVSFAKFRAGIDFRSEAIISNRLGDMLNKPIKVAGTEGIFYTRGKQRQWLNVFIDNSIFIDPFAVSAGAMVTLGPGNKPRYSFGTDMSLEIREWLNVFGSVNSTFRLPTFTDLYYTGPTNMGNPNLEPESAITYELGIKTQKTNYSASFSGFYRNGNNLIDWVREPSETVWTTLNYTRLDAYGIEVILGWKTQSPSALLQSVTISHGYNHSQKGTSNLLSYYVMDYLRHKTAAMLSHKIARNIFFNWSALWQQRAGTYTEHPSNIEKPYNDFIIVNSTIKWQQAGFAVLVDVQNVGNTKYSDLANVPQAGRWISAGVKITIN